MVELNPGLASCPGKLLWPRRGTGAQPTAESHSGRNEAATVEAYWLCERRCLRRAVMSPCPLERECGPSLLGCMESGGGRFWPFGFPLEDPSASCPLAHAFILFFLIWGISDFHCNCRVTNTCKLCVPGSRTFLLPLPLLPRILAPLLHSLVEQVPSSQSVLSGLRMQW